MKKSMLSLIPTLLLSVGAICLTGCTVSTYPYPADGGVAVSGEVDVAGPPPAPLVDEVTISPGPDYVWIGGGWAWDGGRWNWDRGHWGRPPHAGAVWVPHSYAYRGGRHVYTRGHWR